MSDKTPASFLWDAIEAAKLIEQFAHGRTFDQYLSDPMLRAAIEREFQIVGEALTGLRRVAPDMATQIPELSTVIAFRNILVHAYFSIEHDRVWKTIEQNLPALIPLWQRLLAAASSP